MLMLMHPNDPSPAPPPAPMPSGGNSPYEFIMTTPHKPKRSLGGGSMKQRIIIAVGGFSLLLIVVLVFLSLIGGGGSGNTDSLIKLAEQQNEIVRIAGLAKDKASSGSTKNLAITAQLSIQSAQINTLALLKKDGQKVSNKQLTLLQDSTTDQQLTAAVTAGNFDTTFAQVLQDKLISYQIDVQNTYKNATSLSEKQLLQANFVSVAYLLGNQKTS